MKQADIESSSAAEVAFERAWSDPHHTQIELSPLEVNRVVAANYVTSAPATLTAAQLWDNAVKKAWDPATYLPAAVRSSTTCGHLKLSDGAETFVVDGAACVGSETAPLDLWRIVHLTD